MINTNTTPPNLYTTDLDQFLNKDSISQPLGITSSNAASIIFPWAIGFNQTTINTLGDKQDIQSNGFEAGVTGWKLYGDGNIEAVGLTLTGGVLKYGKTSFTDSVHAGYIFDSNGIYVGAVNDVSSLKYNIGTGVFDFIGTVSSRSTLTIANAINDSGQLITDIVNARLNTSAKQIWDSFTFSISGAIQIGTYSAGISGDVKISPNGIVGRNSANATTFALDATTGEITAIKLVGASGSIGSFTIGTYLYTGNKTAYNDVNAGIHIGSDGIGIGNNVFTVSSAGAVVATSINITGGVLDGTSTIGGRLASVLATAIDASGHFADAAISTATQSILGSFTFGASGALQIGTYSAGVSGDLKLSPNGILARDSTGATTFSINGTTGVAVLNGLIVGTNVGLGTAQDSTGVTTIIGNVVTTSFVNALNVNAATVSASISITSPIITGGSMTIGTVNNVFVAGANGIQLGHATFASAPFRVDMAGALTATSATITGALTAGVGSSLPTTYLSGLVSLTNENIAAQGWTSTIVFTATDYRVITWAAGTFTTAAGTSYNILTGNTGNMAATTYIYLDIAVSTTALQHTTTATTANGSGKILIAVANPNADTTSKATLQAFGGIGGQILMVDNIVANSASTNIFITNSAQIADAMITNAKVVSLDVGKLTAGSIYSKAITLAIAAGTGDSYIAAGKTDFNNTVPGFILGLDDSDLDKAKFFIGNDTDYLNFNGVNTIFRTTLADAIIIDYGSNILLKEGGNIKFTSVTAPTACTAALVATGIGNVDNGTHTYKVTYINATGETALGIASNIVTVDAANKQVTLSTIPVSASGSVTGRKVYRTKAGGTDYYLLTTIGNNSTTTYTDNTADINLTGVGISSKENDTFGKIIIDGIESLSLGLLNTFVGQYSGAAISTGTANTACGIQTLLSNSTGFQNTAIGSYSLRGNQSGGMNTSIGAFSLHSNNTGDANVCLGYASGYYESGSNKLFIDNQPRSNEADGRIKSLIYGVFDASTANQKLTINGLFNQSVSKTPANATASGTAGDICWDASYIYVCTATNTWKRIGIATW